MIITPLGVAIGIFLGLAIGLGIAAAAWFNKLKPNTELEYAQLEEAKIRSKEQSELEAQKLLAEAKKEIKHTKDETDKVVERRLQDIGRSEERLDRRQSSLDKRQQQLDVRDQNLNKRQSRLDRQQNELEDIEISRTAELERVASMTQDEAKQELVRAVEIEASQDMARIMREIEDKAKEEGEEKARKLITLAIQRVATEHVSEITISTVEIPNEETKGRIIGRNGRNIRAFEQAAGVDVVVDDTPESVTISSFDPIRREVARQALEKLVVDGRIHPARIEKLIKTAQKEVNKTMKEAAEQAAYEANVHNLHPEILRMMGRLKFRTSYGQNQLQHAVEASKIAAVLSAELGADVESAKLGAFLHDIGKAMDHEQEGTHAQLGAEFIKRYKIPDHVVNAVASHHHEVEQESVEAIIVEVSDAISGARPGARRESLENYIKRIRTLEEIATSFDGVESAYALQAGREIRILVKPGLVDDLEAMRISKKVAKTIEESMQYPGQIQVTVIRETRSVGFAK